MRSEIEDWLSYVNNQLKELKEKIEDSKEYLMAEVAVDILKLETFSKELRDLLNNEEQEEMFNLYEALAVKTITRLIELVD